MIGHQVWGTFAVSDHVVERAFVADALLYDRLVVPTPASDDLERWEANDWQPGRLRKLLDVLRDDNPDYCLAVEVPWGERHRNEWERRWAKEKLTARERTRTRLESADAVMFDDEILRQKRQRGIADPMFVTRKILFNEGDKRRDRALFERHPDAQPSSKNAPPFTNYGKRRSRKAAAAPSSSHAWRSG